MKTLIRLTAIIFLSVVFYLAASILPPVVRFWSNFHFSPAQTQHEQDVEYQEYRVQQVIKERQQHNAHVARDLLDAAEAIRRNPELFGVKP